jgi:hypothetical protein
VSVLSANVGDQPRREPAQEAHPCERHGQTHKKSPAYDPRLPIQEGTPTRVFFRKHLASTSSSEARKQATTSPPPVILDPLLAGAMSRDDDAVFCTALVRRSRLPEHQVERAYNKRAQEAEPHQGDAEYEQQNPARPQHIPPQKRRRSPFRQSDSMSTSSGRRFAVVARDRTLGPD